MNNCYKAIFLLREVFGIVFLFPRTYHYFECTCRDHVTPLLRTLITFKSNLTVTPCYKCHREWYSHVNTNNRRCEPWMHYFAEHLQGAVTDRWFWKYRFRTFVLRPQPACELSLSLLVPAKGMSHTSTVWTTNKLICCLVRDTAFI